MRMWRRGGRCGRADGGVDCGGRVFQRERERGVTCGSGGRGARVDCVPCGRAAWERWGISG